MCVHVYYLLGQTEDGVKFFLEGAGGAGLDYPQEHLVVIRN